MRRSHVYLTSEIVGCLSRKSWRWWRVGACFSSW